MIEIKAGHVFKRSGLHAFRTEEERAMLRILCTERHVCSAPATAMAPEVQQKIHEVIDFKAQLQKASSGSAVSVKTIQDLYAAKAVHGSKTLVTSSFIEQAVTVHKHLLGNDVCRKILQGFEDKFGTNHSLNNITTLSGLVYRAKGQENLQHVLSQLEDEVAAKFRDPTSISKLFLLGKARDSKGYADVCIRKLELSKLIHSQIAACGISADGIRKLGEVMQSHQKYRELCGFPSKVVDQTWLGSLPEPDQKAILLMIDVKYGHDQDTQLLATFSTKSSTDLMGEEPIAGRLAEIKNAVHDKEDNEPAMDLSEEKDAVQEPLTASNLWKFIDHASGENPHPELARIDPEQKLGEFREHVRNVVSRYVTTLVEPTSASSWADYLRANPTGMKKGMVDGNGYVVINYDSKQTGEAATHPHIRVPGLRDNGHLSKLVTGVLLGHAGSDGFMIDNGDAFLFWDGGKHGNDMALLAGFKEPETSKKIPHSKATFYVQYDESSVAARRDRIRGSGAVNCVEFLHLVTKAPAILDNNDRTHYSGTNRSNFIGPVVLAPHSSLASVTFKQKKEVLGKARFEVGGKTEGVVSDAPPKRREDADTEPLAYHAMCPEIYQSLANTLNATAWIDLTAMDPTLAVVAVASRTPYIGIMLNEKHQEWFEGQVADLVFQSMQDPQNPFYKPHLAAIVAAAANTTTPSPAPKGQPPPKGKAKAKAKTKAKAKANDLAAKLKQQLASLRGAKEDAADDNEEDEDEDDEEASGEDA